MMSLTLDPELVRKYNVPTPRYTSYPTVPHWDTDAFDKDTWKVHVTNAFETRGKEEGISLYIHLPYCESLCTYCGCTTRITVNHNVEAGYIETVLKEWKLYLLLFKERPLLKELHLGGGTPTFFSAPHLKWLVEGILRDVEVSSDAEFSFEGHPNNTTEEHLRTLYEKGFSRVSFGIQDFDPKVQEVVNRKQSFGQVEYVTDLARLIGYTSVNFDLIYGLPLQTIKSVTDTIEKVKRLKPDRIAFYSYAHVPWIKPGQRKFTELDLPDDETKLGLYEAGRTQLEASGYVEIGMDHFALPSDALFKAMEQSRLHRNFMGYTTSNSSLLIGLGCSSISDVGTAYAQNQKTVEGYSAKIKNGDLAVCKGHFLTEEDKEWRYHILNLSCRLKTYWEFDLGQPHHLEKFKRLILLQKEGLIDQMGFLIKVTPKGKRFLRTICSVFDAKLNGEQEVLVFSKAV